MKRLFKYTICVVVFLFVLFLSGCVERPGSSYQIVFDGNGGTLVSGKEVQSIKHNKDIKEPVYEREGYDFDGWDQQLEKISSAKTIKALWKIKIFKVTFSGEGGLLEYGDEVQHIEYGKSANPPSYFFQGHNLSWDKSYDNVKSDLNIKAVWIQQSLQVTFNGNGGSLISGDEHQEVLYGEAAIPPVYEKYGYYITGWSAYYEYIEYDINIYPLWEIGIFNINFETNGGFPLDSFAFPFNSYIPNLPTPEKEGHDFAGWFLDNDTFLEPFYQYYVPGYDLTLFAKWEPKMFTVTFHSNDGTYRSYTEQVAYGEAANAPDFEREGYRLSWDQPFDEVKSHLEIYAIWEMLTFKVTFIGNGGTLISGQEEQYVPYGSSVIPPIYSNNDYSLTWDYDLDFIRGDAIITAYWYTPGLIFNDYGEGCEVSGNDVLASDVLIPDYFEGLKVLKIKNFGFENNQNIETITFGQYISIIGQNAFYDCITLNKVDFLINVNEIGIDAFKNCEGIESVYITDLELWFNINFKNTYANPLSYAKEWYLNNELIEVLTIPNTVKLLRAESFGESLNNFLGIEKMIISNSVEEILGLTISNLNPEEVEFEIGTQLTKIDDSAFRNSRLKKITIPATIEEIGSWAFHGCKQLEDVIFEEDSQLNKIGQSAFYGCESLNSITIPKGVTIIEMSAFSLCYDLEYVYFENNNELITIGGYAFSQCYALEMITIPRTVTSLGTYAFLSCDNLEFVIFEENSQLAEIGSSAFAYCSALKSITIPESTVLIRESAFYNCSTLKTVNILGNIEELSNQVFNGCSELEYISLPPTITSIGHSAFMSCSKLISITIPSAVNTISNWAFAYCSSLEEVNLSNNITQIGEFAFFLCSNLKSLVLPDSLEIIGGSAFDRCSSLESLILLEAVSSIGKDAFVRCSNLTIYVENESKPNDWDDNWVDFPGVGNRVIWGTILGDNNEVLSIPLTSYLIGYSLNNPYYEDHIFDGWYFSSNFDSYKYMNLYEVTEEGILYARWITTEEETNYMIVFDSNGGTPVDCITALAGTTINLPDDPSREYYHFEGWYYDNYTFNELFELVVMPTGNITVYAKWELESYTVTFDGSGGELIEGEIVQTVKRGSSAIAPVYYQDGLTYSWDTDFTNVTGDITVKAYWYSQGLSFVSYENGYEVSKGIFNDVEAIIPELYNGLPVIKIGHRGFYWLSNLVKIDIPNTVLEIGDYAFALCVNLSEVRLPSNLEIIDYGLFQTTPSLKEIDLPLTITTIKDGAFLGSAVSYVHLPLTIVNLQGMALEHSTVIYTEFPDYPETWGQYYNLIYFNVYIDDILTDDNFQYLIIDESVVVTNCIGTDLVVEIPAIVSGVAVTKLGDLLFVNTNIKEVYLPSTISSYGRDVFKRTKLEKIEVDVNNDWYQAIDGVLFTKDLKQLLAYPNYKTGLTYQIFEGVETIAAIAFANAFYLEEIEIADSVIEILENAFGGSHIKKVYFSNQSLLTIIGDHAFSAMEYLEEIELPSNLETIDSYAFASSGSDDNPLNIFIPKTTKTIQFRAFYRTKLGSITFEDNSELTSINNEAFYELYYLSHIVIPESVLVIFNNAFNDSIYNINNLTIFTEIYEIDRPEGWHKNCFGDLDVYWLGEWHYDIDGNPVPN